MFNSEDELKQALFNDLDLDGDIDDYFLYDLTRRASLAGFGTPSGIAQIPVSITFSGSQSKEWRKIVNSSNNTTIHLIAGEGFTGPELLGLGINAPNSKGLVLDVNTAGSIGAQVALFPGDSASSFGFDLVANAESLGTLFSVNTFGATGLAFDLHAQGTPSTNQILSKWRTDALSGRGFWGATLLQVFSDTGNIEFTGPLVRANGALFSVMTADLAKTGNMDRIDLVAGNTGTPYLALRKFSGTSGKFFSQRINPSGASGATLDAGTGAFVPGTDTWTTCFKWGMNSGNPTLGFYSATPVAQQILPTGASKTVDDIITVLQTLGLVKQA